MKQSGCEQHADFFRYCAELQSDALLAYLETLHEPVWECELMRVALPAADLVNGAALEMYRWHFVLFHALYGLQSRFAGRGRYLFVHFMRTCVRDLPAVGCCRYFDEDSAAFCGAGCDAGAQFCAFHGRRGDDLSVDMLSERYFYLDPANFSALAAENAEKFISGAWNLLHHQEEYRRCLAVMGLPEGVSLDLLRKRFRHLARTLHPDINPVDHAEFARINSAYRTLLKLLNV